MKGRRARAGRAVSMAGAAWMAEVAREVGAVMVEAVRQGEERWVEEARASG